MINIIKPFKRFLLYNSRANFFFPDKELKELPKNYLLDPPE